MKSKRKLNESQHYYEGKAAGHAGKFGCTSRRESPEFRDYLRGFQEGIAEAYGSSDLSEQMPATPAPAASSSMPTTSMPMTTPAMPASTSGSSTSMPTAMAEADNEYSGFGINPETGYAPAIPPSMALDETMFLDEIDDHEDAEDESDDDELDSEFRTDLDDELDELEQELKSMPSDIGDDDQRFDEESRGKHIKKMKDEARKQGKTSVHVFGQDIAVDETYNPFTAMESAIKTDAMISAWNTQLMNLLNEAKKCKDCRCEPCECTKPEQRKKEDKQPVKEGLTVTTTMGNQHGPDSLSINATDQDAHELMRILKHSGINVGLGSLSDEHEGYAEEDCGCPDPSDCDCDDTDSPEMLGDYSDMPTSSAMMSRQEKPMIASLSLQPKSAVGFDDVLGGLMEDREIDSILFLSGQRTTLMETGPSGAGMMSKSANDKEARPNQPTDQKAIMGSLKPAKIETNGSLERLQKSHDAGPVDSKTGKRVGKSESKSEPKEEHKSEKARSDDSASLSEALANDLYKIYAIAEDANTDVVSGYKKVSTMAMPRGMGMSVQTEDKPHEPIEPADVEDVMKALDQGAPEPVKFPKLEKLMKAHMPDVEEPEYNEKAEEGETAKITGPIDDHYSAETSDDFENEVREDDHEQRSSVREALEHDDREQGRRIDDSMVRMAETYIHNAMAHDQGTQQSGIQALNDWKSRFPDVVSRAFESMHKKQQDRPFLNGDMKKKFLDLFEKYTGLTTTLENREMCSECGTYMEEDHQCESTKEQLEEWANDQGRHGTDEAQLMDTEYIVNTNSDGLNRRKINQTTLPHTEVKVRADEDLAHWLRLSGLK